MTPATPRPWAIQELENGRLYLESDEAGRDVCDLNQVDDQPSEEETANAALIVEAVNAYDRLRAEHAEMRVLLTRLVSSAVGRSNDTAYIEGKDVDVARALLAKMEVAK